MKNYAVQYLTKSYIANHTTLKEGVLTLERDEPGLIEYIFPVRLMKQVVLDLDASTTYIYRRRWFDHTPHWIAYHYELDEHRSIVVMHRFGGLKGRIQLIDSTEYA